MQCLAWYVTQDARWFQLATERTPQQLNSRRSCLDGRKAGRLWEYIRTVEMCHLTCEGGSESDL